MNKEKLATARFGGLTWKEIIKAIQTRPTVEVWPYAGPTLGYRSKSAAYDAKRLHQDDPARTQDAGADTVVAGSAGTRWGTTATAAPQGLAKRRSLVGAASAFSTGRVASATRALDTSQ